ncbi:MAG: NAD-dependent deacylase [Chloroflexaceae bacterium]|nr:NAD-dependent deacylase [Chloroflexaceae bacterium]
MEQNQISEIVRLLQGSKKAVALTGAGISKPSGIPDFRSDSGLWAEHDPAEVASLAAFQRHPERFYTWLRPLLHTMLAARPNPAHQALAQLQRLGKLHAIITQNIDGLHQAAGSREVFELHGHVRTATCLDCDKHLPSDSLWPEIMQQRTPRCRCGGLLKPDVVLFDEMLPRGLFWLAQHAVETADLLLVAGTSLEVFPVADLPLTALRRGAKLVIINLSETYLDERADLVLRADVATALPQIVQSLQSEQ